jgi:cysteine synthase
MLGTTTGSGSDLAKRMAERKDWINLGQYSSASNPESYEKLLAPAAIGALNGCIQVFAAGLGSAGTFVGLGGAIKRSVPDVTMVAVIPHGGEDIPGCRDERRLKDVTHDWRSCADHVGYVTGGSAYRASLAMWRAGIPAGPSAGAALVGLCDYLAKARAERRLTGLRGPDGTVQCLFPCADLLSPYWDELQRHASDVGDRVKIA